MMMMMMMMKTVNYDGRRNDVIMEILLLDIATIVATSLPSLASLYTMMTLHKAGFNTWEHLHMGFPGGFRSHCEMSSPYVTLKNYLGEYMNHKSSTSMFAMFLFKTPGPKLWTLS